MLSTTMAKIRGFQLFLLLLISTLSIGSVVRPLPRTNVTYTLEKRVDFGPDNFMQATWPPPPAPYPRNTWKGYLEEPVFNANDNSKNWGRQKIQELAEQGYVNVNAQKKDSIQLVAALWIPGVAVYLSTIPRDDGVSQLLYDSATDTVNPPAPAWAKAIPRAKKDLKLFRDVFHAEDGACWSYENDMRVRGMHALNTLGEYTSRRGAQRPYIAIFGKRIGWKRTGRANPCFGLCKKEMEKLGIDFDVIDENVNKQ